MKSRVGVICQLMDELKALVGCYYFMDDLNYLCIKDKEDKDSGKSMSRVIASYSDVSSVASFLFNLHSDYEDCLIRFSECDAHGNFKYSTSMIMCGDEFILRLKKCVDKVKEESLSGAGDPGINGLFTIIKELFSVRDGVDNELYFLSM